MVALLAIITAPFGSNVAEQEFRPESVIRLSESKISTSPLDFEKSVGVIQTISPSSQKSGLELDGVPPPRIVGTTSFKRSTRHVSGGVESQVSDVSCVL